MKIKPKAIENFEQERISEYDSSLFEHPVERLKYHINFTGGKILKSEFTADGMAYVIWESESKHYRAWCSWPSQSLQIHWKPESKD